MDFFHQQIAIECLHVLTLFEAQHMQRCTNQTKTSDSSPITLVTRLSPLCPVTDNRDLSHPISLNHTFSPFNSPVTISEFNCFKKMVFIGAMSVFWWDQSCACQPGTKYKRRKFILDSMVDWIIALWRCPHPNSQKLWIFWNSSTGIPSPALALFVGMLELFQILKDDAVKVLHSICQQIWKTQQWPQDWKRSLFIPIPKKGNAKECSNYHTIALISHASKVMLQILQARLQQYMNHELLDVQLKL